MEIAGYDIDVQQVIDEAIVKTFNYSIGPLIEVKNLSAKFEGLVWDLLMAELVKNLPPCPDTTAERAVCALIKKGVGKDRISYHGGRFKVVLTNRKYKIQRSTECFRSAPAGALRMITVKGMPADVFADCMLAFDSLIPEIGITVRKLEANIREEQRKQRQEELAAQMTIQSVQSLIDEYITPLGLDASFYINDGKVSIDLTLRKEASFTLPLDELARTLKDTDGVMAALETVHEDGLEYRDPVGRSLFHTKYSRAK